jgi:hypothetical protein
MNFEPFLNMPFGSDEVSAFCMGNSAIDPRFIEAEILFHDWCGLLAERAYFGHLLDPGILEGLYRLETDIDLEPSAAILAMRVSHRFGLQLAHLKLIGSVQELNNSVKAMNSRIATSNA